MTPGVPPEGGAPNFLLSLRNQIVKEIHGGRLNAELANHPDDLPAVECRVIDHMLDLLGERQCKRLALQVFITQLSMQPLLAQTFE